jgi:hypothetical protein
MPAGGPVGFHSLSFFHTFTQLPFSALHGRFHVVAPRNTVNMALVIAAIV